MFRFEKEVGSRSQYVAGLDTDPASGDLKLLKLWTAKRSFQVVVTAIALTFVFYAYVGLSGGITDGFDRFTEPVEPLAETLGDPNYQPPLPPGAWTGVPFE